MEETLISTERFYSVYLREPCTINIFHFIQFKSIKWMNGLIDRKLTVVCLCRSGFLCKTGMGSAHPDTYSK